MVTVNKRLMRLTIKYNGFPKWGHDRIFNMVRDRGDWVISRQRILGRANSYLLL